MRALQRLVITAHWAAFLQGVVGIVVASAVLLSEDEREKLHGEDIPLFILMFFGPLFGLALVLWVFTGKFILWPWHRSLPKQEN